MPKVSKIGKPIGYGKNNKPSKMPMTKKDHKDMMNGYRKKY